MADVTQILSQIEQGDPSAAEELLPLVYEELRNLAAAKLAHEKPGQTLQATALVHEAYLRLTGRNTNERWENRRHFFSAAATAMQRILVEAARRKLRLKRGGDRQRIELENIAIPLNESPERLLGLDEALERLVLQLPEAAEVVQLRYFVGLSIEEAADVLGVSRATAYRHWTFAKAWLQSELNT